jgi:polygalacturonase
MWHSVHLAALGVLLAVALAPVCAADERAEHDAALAAILAQIRPPSFPNRDFLITDYGAVGDGRVDCKAAFTKAIAACTSAGGRVVVPEGVWLVNGPIHLKSKVNLHVQAGATIRFSHDAEDYLPPVFTRFEGTELVNYSPLVYALDQENVAVTGGGTLDGQAGRGRWWQWKGKWGGEVDHGWRPGEPDQTEAVKKLIGLADAAVAPEKGVFGAGSLLRPNFIQFYRCKNVLLEGVTLIDSPMWVVHPVLCENVTVRGVTVNSHGPNNDGCDPESCRHVLIEKCTFDTGDDCIAIKSGRNADGRRLNAPSENIVVRGCTMKDGHGGVTLGSEMSGGIRNVFVEDCTMSSPRLERAIRLKSNSQRGGTMENLFVRDVAVGEVSDAVIHVDLRYNNESGEHVPLVRNVYIDHLKSAASKRSLCLLGIEGRPIENVVISNCEFRNVKEPCVVEYVERLLLENVMQAE